LSAEVSAPAALFALPFVIGCACGLLLNDAVCCSAFALCTAAAALLALLGAAVSLGTDDAPVCTVAIVAGAVLAGMSLGTAAGSRAYYSPLQTWFDARQPGNLSAVVLLGRLREDAARTPTGVSIVVDVTSVTDDGGLFRLPGVRSLGGVRLSVSGTLAAKALAEWRAGRWVRVTATLRRPVTYRNPGVPDEARALARRGVSLVGSVKSAALVEVTADGPLLSEWAAAIRAWIRRMLAVAVGTWSTRSAGVAAAIVIGDRTGLEAEDERRLQEAGTYHVIAISGGNIAILTLVLLGVLRWLCVSLRISAAVAIVVLLLYGQVIGPAPSVDRAIAAAVVYLAGRLLEQHTSPLNVLAVAAVLGLGASPVAVFDPGFILSFGATLGILVGLPRLARWVALSTVSLLRNAAGLLAATVTVELALMPVAAALFGRATCAGLLLNFAAVPLMAVVQIASIATLALGFSSPDASQGVGYVVHLAARGLIDSARLVDRAPWMARDVAPPSWWLVACYYAALALSLWPAREAIRTPRFVALGLGALIVIGPHTASRDGVTRAAVGDLRVVFLDVGQGDATLILLPDGRSMLVDAGGLPAAPLQDPKDGPAFDIGERVVARTLRAFGVRTLDTFVLTHGDPDHMGGARSVLRAFRPRAIWEGVPVPPHAALQALRVAADETDAEWRTVQAADRVEIAGVELVALHPPSPEWERQRVRNDDSIVLALRYGDVSVILPGDIGGEGESRVVEHLRRTPLVVLKAPHHGSATSSSPQFVKAVGPNAVIFSAGRNNHFNHPAPAVVARYRALGVTMFSTANDGAVILDTDGRRVVIRTWSGRTAYFKTD
jgi:competence protein ComEC